MKFKFPFVTLLKKRKYDVEDARKEYFEAQNLVDETTVIINEHWRKIDEARDRAAKLQQEDGASMEYIASFDHFIYGEKIRIEREKTKLREQMMVAEQKRDILVEAAKEHKILEKLKERLKEKHKKKMLKRERKQIDDLVTMKFKRGRYGQGL